MFHLTKNRKQQINANLKNEKKKENKNIEKLLLDENIILYGLNYILLAQSELKCKKKDI